MINFQLKFCACVELRNERTWNSWVLRKHRYPTTWSFGGYIQKLSLRTLWRNLRKCGSWTCSMTWSTHGALWRMNRWAQPGSASSRASALSQIELPTEPLNLKRTSLTLSGTDGAFFFFCVVVFRCFSFKLWYLRTNVGGMQFPLMHFITVATHCSVWESKERVSRAHSAVPYHQRLWSSP